MFFRWLGRTTESLAELISDIAQLNNLDSDDQEPDEEDSVLDQDPESVLNDSSYLQPSRAADEEIIREIVRSSVSNEATARQLVVNLMGLSRTLTTMAAAAMQQTADKRICIEASSVASVTASCEKMLRGVSNYRFIERYSFVAEHEGDEDE